jgi:hypothetical protein
MLEAACDYQGTARFVAFYWIPGGDELMWNDGWTSTDGEWGAWLAYSRHPRVRPHLAAYHFGDSDREAQHWFLLDRQERRAFVGTPRDVQAFLYAHNAPPAEDAAEAVVAGETLVLDLEQLTQALTEAWEEVPSREISMEEVQARMAASQQRITDLVAWLNQQD